MEVIFNAVNYKGERIENTAKEIYKQAIISIYTTLKYKLDLSLLSSFIVPEDYESELFELQRINGHSNFITKNEYGQGIAQVVSCKEKELYNIIVDKNVIFLIIPENQLNSIEISLGHEYKTFLNSRQLAIYTVYHEFAHVHEFALNKNIKWLKEFKGNGELESHYFKLALDIWREYFACRTASISLVLQSEDLSEIITTCSDAENMLREKRRKYHRHILSLEDFVIDFHNYTSFILNKIGSAHGNLFSLEDRREEMIGLMEECYQDSYVKAIWVDLGITLYKLYEQHPMWTNQAVFKKLIDLIKNYYNQFEIYISDTGDGLYYDIPVRL